MLPFRVVTVERKTPPPVPMRRKKNRKNEPISTNTATKTLPKSPKYPPLIFTRADFENVMASSLKNPQNHLKSSLELTEKINNDVPHFRVSTTNLPFEKCFENYNIPSINDAEFKPDKDKWWTTKNHENSLKKSMTVSGKTLEAGGNIGQPNEMKNKMLDELLNNFNKIKLKTISSNDNNEKNEKINTAVIRERINKVNMKTVDSISSDNSACSVDKKTDNTNKDLMINCDNSLKYRESTKQIRKKPEIIISTAYNNKNSIKTIRNHVCAIVSNNNNDNDNNTSMITVSLDQMSRDTVTIKSVNPGRVKNNVKNYQFNGEQTRKYSKSNDSDSLVVDSVKQCNEDTKMMERKINHTGTIDKKSVKFNSRFTVMNVDNSGKIKRKAPLRPEVGVKDTKQSTGNFDQIISHQVCGYFFI